MLPNYLDNICETWEPVGSRVTCDPAPTDTDQDILVLLTKEQWPIFLEELQINHWEKCAGKQDDMPPVPGPPSDFPSIQEWDAAMDLYEAALDKLDSYGDIGDGASFEAWRLGELNLILTMDEFWFDKFMEASDCCKALNVMDKQERIAIFKRIVPESKTVVKTSSYPPEGGWMPPPPPSQQDWINPVMSSTVTMTWNIVSNVTF